MVPVNEVDRSDTAARLAMVTGRLNRRLRSAGGGLSHGLLSALSTLAKHGPLRLSDLAQIEMVSAPSTTRLVAELESKGLVSRQSDPDDGRAYLISITTAGEGALSSTRSRRAQTLTDLMSKLDDNQRAAITDAMPVLEQLLED
jgi:DNA-binding MarR family transcriptional regulator